MPAAVDGVRELDGLELFVAVDLDQHPFAVDLDRLHVGFVARQEPAEIREKGALAVIDRPDIAVLIDQITRPAAEHIESLAYGATTWEDGG